MKTVDIVVGLQWGDEGKGKIVDLLAPSYDIVARFQGGPNAGHTLKSNGTTHVLHSIPSGVFHPNIKNVIGNGVVIDPVLLKKEIEDLSEVGIDVKSNLLISKKAHLILPTHILLDKAHDKVGTTHKGIGPAYTDKTARNGLRVGDLLYGDWRTEYQDNVTTHGNILLMDEQTTKEYLDLEERWLDSIRFLLTLQIINTEYYLNESIAAGKYVLAEGAQGSLLDVDFGSYPYVTSSNTISAAACVGLGIPPTRINGIVGVFKSYCTRVGNGPFPTEVDDELAEKIRTIGNEFGATTGRPRRIGWLDIPALRYAIMLSGVTELAMMKPDVLSDFDTIKVCTGYDEQATMYQEFESWKGPLGKELPEQLKEYINYIELQVGVPIRVVSIGPDRSETCLLPLHLSTEDIT